MVTGTKRKVNWIFEAVNPQQDAFMSSTATRLLFSGAFGAGKTIVLCAKALKLSLDYPGNFGYICRKVRATIGLSTLKTFLELVCPKELIADYNKQEGLITLTNGSQILFGGLDDPLKLGSLGAGGVGFVGIDEAIETVEDDWNMLEGRLRKPGVPHIIMAATNPGPPSHYLYRLFFQEHRGAAYQASSFDNPELPKDYQVRLGEFTGTYYERYVLGKWVGLEGLVYSNFDEKVCLIPRMEIPLTWPVYVGHDFGDANPAALFYAGNPGTGEFWAFAEYLPKDNPSTYAQVQEFKRITAGRNVLKRIGGSHQEGASRRDYTAQGWLISEPREDLTNQPKAQRKRVLGLHALNKVIVFSDLIEYKKEKFSFAYEKKEDVLTDNIANEARFHLMACERYILSDFTPETVIKGTARRSSNICER